MPRSNKELLQIYQIYSQTVENTTDRRLKTNNLYIALNTLLIGLLVAFIKWDNSINCIAFIIIGVLGFLLSLLWKSNIQSYRQLNEAKFKIILKLEEKLPFACYTDEWDILGKGKDSKRYHLLSKIEAKIPLLFSVVFFLLLVVGVFMMIL